MKTKKVTFIRNGMGFGLGYFAGDTTIFPKKQADELIELKIVEPFKGAEIKIDLPDDIPGRAVLIKNGVCTIAEINSISDLTEFNGIGKTTEKEIREYLKS